jgi:hypothetical protein
MRAATVRDSASSVAAMSNSAVTAMPVCSGTIQSVDVAVSSVNPMDRT